MVCGHRRVLYLYQNAGRRKRFGIYLLGSRTDFRWPLDNPNSSSSRALGGTNNTFMSLGEPEAYTRLTSFKIRTRVWVPGSVRNPIGDHRVSKTHVLRLLR